MTPASTTEVIVRRSAATNLHVNVTPERVDVALGSGYSVVLNYTAAPKAARENLLRYVDVLRNALLGDR